MTFGVGGPLLGGIVGWGAYLALGVFILRARRLSSLLSLLGVFVVLVLLNIAGCGAMIGGAWKRGTILKSWLRFGAIFDIITLLSK